MIERYYEDELRYLHDAGREFAKAHPDRARYLNIDAVGDRDPYVERLFEGFAFLTARVREKLDDSFPELSTALLNQLWPHLMHEIPSMAIVEFLPRRGLLQQTRTLQRGVEMLSAPVGPESTTCRFRTTQAVRLNPLSVARVERETDTHGRETLTLVFRCDTGVAWQSVDLGALRLHIHGELPAALQIYQHLVSRVVAARVSVDETEQSWQIPAAEATTPGGFAREESLEPLDPRAFWGYTLLLEYFAYPEKFLFVDLHGLERLRALVSAPGEIRYALTFDSGLPVRAITADTFRLHCSPAVNLFVHDAETVLADGRREEYRVVADSSHPGSVCPHSVVSVTGTDRATGERTVYRPVSTLDRWGSQRAATFAPHYRTQSDGRRGISLSMHGNRLAGETLREESLSIEARCTNGALPRECLNEGDIRRPGKGLPDYVTAVNITRPTLPHLPPPDEARQWVFLSHFSATSLSLGSAQALRALLDTHDWARSESTRRRIESVVDVAIEPAERLTRGTVLRGVRYIVTLDEGSAGEHGDIFLFGRVLRAFLARYATINASIEVVLKLRPSGATVALDQVGGTRWPI